MKPRPREIKKLSQSLRADTEQSCDLDSGPSDTLPECIESYVGLRDDSSLQVMSSQPLQKLCAMPSIIHTRLRAGSQCSLEVYFKSQQFLFMLLQGDRHAGDS